MKRFLLLLFAIFPLLAMAEDFEKDGIYYNITSSTDLTVEVTYPYDGRYGYSEKVTIPNSVFHNEKQYKVTGIGQSTFAGLLGLTSVTIPNSVTSIGSNAFQNCTGLTSLIIPNSVTNIGGRAFLGCVGLKSVSIPNSLTNIGSGVFALCSGLTSLTIPNSVTNIEKEAFYGCSGLTSLIIPNSVNAIGENAFAECSGILYVNCNIPSNAFEGSKFSEVEIGDDVTIIEQEAFRNCSSLTSLTIGKNVISIGERAFSYCSGLTSLVIPNSMSSIREFTFYGCSGLTSLIIPSSVNTIGERAFDGCTQLKDVAVHRVTPYDIYGLYPFSYRDLRDATLHVPAGSVEAYKAAYGWEQFGNIVAISGEYLMDGDKFEADGIYYKVTSVANKTVMVTYKGENYDSYDNEYTGNISIPATVSSGNTKFRVTGIDFAAFAYCTKMTSIAIPNSVISIDNAAFFDCEGLTSVNLPEDITTINNQTFQLCYNLASVTIPNGVTSIGKKAFSECRELTSITIPNSVTSIGDEAFFGCQSMTRFESLVKYPPSCGSQALSGIDKSECTLYVPELTMYAYMDTDPWKDFMHIVAIPVTNLENGDTFEVSGIYYIVSSAEEKTASVTYKGKYFDSYSDEYKDNIIIPETVSFNGTPYNVTRIGRSAFRGCTDISSVTIPNSVTSIGYGAFYGDTSMKSLNIPNSVTFIDEWAFANCSSLTSVTIPSSLESLSMGVFQGCENLKSIVIPSNIKEIGQQAFCYCYGLETIKILEGVKTINLWAFYGANKVQELHIPASVEKIYPTAFAHCEGLNTITVDSNNEVYNSNNNCNAIIETYMRTLIAGCNNTIIPNDIITIEERAFEGCTFSSITLPPPLKEIGYCAFYGCKNLASLDIPVSVTYIDQYVFEACTALKDVTVHWETPYDISGLNVFYNCDLSNATLHVPAGSVDAYKAAEGWKEFGNIVGFSSDYKIYYTANKKIELPSYADWYGNTIISHTFEDGVGCISFSNEITSIGFYAFNGCHDLTSVTIPNSVTYIAEGAFSYCDNLETINIPSGITTIGDRAFQTCINLKSITVNAQTPPVCQNFTFEMVYLYIPVYVPKGCKALYESDEIWGRFYNIIEMSNGDDAIEEITLDQQSDLIYNLDGVKVDNNYRGISVRNGKKVLVK